MQAWLTGETLQEQDKKEISNVISRGLQSQREPVIVQFKSHIDLLFSSMVQFFVDQVNVDATDFRRQLKYALLQEQPMSKANYVNFESKIIQFTAELERELLKLETQLQIAPLKESFSVTSMNATSVNKNAMNKDIKEQQKNAQSIGMETTNVQKNRNTENRPSKPSHDSQKKPASLTWENSSEDNEFIVLESKETDT